MGCCRERVRPVGVLTFCQLVEDQGSRLPLQVVQAAAGIQFEVAWAGRVVELFDAARAFDCRGAQGRAIRALERNAAVLQVLAAPLVGKTITLARLSLLR